MFSIMADYTGDKRISRKTILHFDLFSNMVNIMSNDYPHLYQLMGAYLNIDYDITGNTVEEVIDYYIKDTQDEYLFPLLKEIERFELEYANDLATQFETLFSPGIIIDDLPDFFKLIKDKVQENVRIPQPMAG